MDLHLVQFFFINEYIHNKNLTIYKFVADPCQMTWTRLVWAFKTTSSIKINL